MAKSVTLPVIMLCLSLKRQSLPPKKQSSVTTFCKNPSFEFGYFYYFSVVPGTATYSDFIASFKVEWICALISELLNPCSNPVPAASFSPEASIAD